MIFKFTLLAFLMTVVSPIIVMGNETANPLEYPPCPSDETIILEFCFGKRWFGEGASYEGTFRNGLPDGFGTYYWPDGTIDEGYFEKGYLNGEAVRVHLMT